MRWEDRLEAQDQEAQEGLEDLAQEALEDLAQEVLEDLAQEVLEDPQEDQEVLEGTAQEVLEDQPVQEDHQTALTDSSMSALRWEVSVLLRVSRSAPSRRCPVWRV